MWHNIHLKSSDKKNLFYKKPSFHFIEIHHCECKRKRMFQLITQIYESITLILCNATYGEEIFQIRDNLVPLLQIAL